jgi:hypothetical protein
VATANQVPLTEQPSVLTSLRQYLDGRRDPNLPLRVTDATAVPIDVAVEVDVDDRYPRQGTADRVMAALSPQVNPDGSLGFFSFDRLQFGQSIALSDLYRAVQDVEGVRSSLVTLFRLAGPNRDPDGTVRDVIAIDPTQFAFLKNDPNDPDQGTLTVTLTPNSGGFPDT